MEAVLLEWNGSRRAGSDSGSRHFCGLLPVEDDREAFDLGLLPVEDDREAFDLGLLPVEDDREKTRGTEVRSTNSSLRVR
jgi:hypothetical protein